MLKKDDDAFSLSQILKKAQTCFQAKKQFAIVVEKGALESEETLHFQNGFHIRREEAIQHVISSLQSEDVIISTTGKISREVYEQSNAISVSYTHLDVYKRQIHHISHDANHG